MGRARARARRRVLLERVRQPRGDHRARSRREARGRAVHQPGEVPEHGLEQRERLRQHLGRSPRAQRQRVRRQLRRASTPSRAPTSSSRPAAPRRILTGGGEAMSEALFLAFQKLGVLGVTAPGIARRRRRAFLASSATSFARVETGGADARSPRSSGYGTAFQRAEGTTHAVFARARRMSARSRGALADAVMARADVDLVVERRRASRRSTTRSSPRSATSSRDVHRDAEARLRRDARRRRRDRHGRALAWLGGSAPARGPRPAGCPAKVRTVLVTSDRLLRQCVGGRDARREPRCRFHASTSPRRSGNGIARRWRCRPRVPSSAIRAVGVTPAGSCASRSRSSSARHWSVLWSRSPTPRLGVGEALNGRPTAHRVRRHEKPSERLHGERRADTKLTRRW